MADTLDVALGVSVAVARVPTPGIRDKLAAILLDILREPQAPGHGS